MTTTKRKPRDRRGSRRQRFQLNPIAVRIIGIAKQVEKLSAEIARLSPQSGISRNDMRRSATALEYQAHDLWGAGLSIIEKGGE